MKNLIILIFFLYGYAYSQVVKEKIISFESNIETTKEVCDISKNGTIIVKESFNNDSSAYYLYLLNKEKKKVFLAGSSNNRKGYAWFSNNYVVIRLISNTKTYIKIFDTKNGIEKTIENESGNVVSSSVLNLNNIIYQLRTPDKIPKIFYLKNNKETFIANGIGEKWSPDGKWILVKNVNKIKLKKNKDTNDENNSFCKIYNLSGTEVLTLNNFKNVVDIRWSPNSDKIVLREINDKGFYILYLESLYNRLVVKDTYHFKGFEKIDSNFIVVINPEWDLNGENIVYAKAVEDGENILETSIWTHNVNNHTNQIITDRSPKNVFHIGFNSNGNIILAEGDDGNGTNIFQISLK